jgi:predicted house-cleaning noncanonical NTP pyrophosphatase (MazG superfamily)
MDIKTNIWNKIVRDRIPEIVENSGGSAETRLINDNNEFDSLMRKKLKEEVMEIEESAKDHILEELGDLETIIDTLLVLHGFTREELKIQQEKKDKERGKFEKRIFLVSTERGKE